MGIEQEAKAGFAPRQAARFLSTSIPGTYLGGVRRFLKAKKRRTAVLVEWLGPKGSLLPLKTQGFNCLKSQVSLLRVGLAFALHHVGRSRGHDPGVGNARRFIFGPLLSHQRQIPSHDAGESPVLLDKSCTQRTHGLSHRLHYFLHLDLPQNFSAGILLGAIAGELFPILQDVKTWRGHENGDEFAGEAIGFLAGLGLMYAVKILAERFEEDEEDVEPALKAEDEFVNPVGKQLATVAESKQNLEEGGTSGPPAAIKGASGEIVSVAAEASALDANVKVLTTMLTIEPFDRDCFDKVLHEVQWNADCLRRQMRGAGPVTAHHKERMAFHIDELVSRLQV
jgi:hypothetical protein